VNGVRGRRFVWSDPEVQKLASRFVVAMDNEGVLRDAKSAEGELYRHVVDDLGHFKGEFTDSSNNRQGIYCIAPSGEFLDSVYSIEDPVEVAAMLRRALAKWEALPEEKRLAPQPYDPSGAMPRTEKAFPADGLVLMESMRDLPRKPPPAGDWLAGSWNKDYVWFRKAEAQRFLPKRRAKGATATVPRSLVNRLAAHHFVDYVQCIGYPYEYRTIKHASLTSTVTQVEKGRMTLRLEGMSKTSQEGARPGSNPEPTHTDQWRGVEVAILGRATYDLKAERFTAFDVVAIGKRWGGLRWKDEGGPIGFEFRLARGRSMDRTPPYGLAWGELLANPYW
jgi:hypothetical protein